mmetsp:Transcript_163/g.239  ORF Transcript_163/g.239 Transcript_163/m.239 type:complete len:297 (-) Transcript_163:265-1155(-)
MNVVRASLIAYLGAFSQQSANAFTFSPLPCNRAPTDLLKKPRSDLLQKHSISEARFFSSTQCDVRLDTMFLRSAGNGGMDDPNPGGMNNWNDNNGNGGDDENFLDVLKAWLKSDEGKEDIQTYTISLCVALLLRFTIIEPRYIPSLSMYPTFDVGDQLAVEKVTKRIRPFNRNEVVVFNPPDTFRQIVSSNYGIDAKKSKEALIKRIVAVEGDQVLIKQGKLYVNGQKQDEPFTAEDAQYEFGPVTVPPGDVLVLGDNRNHSLDGHIWGFLPKENVIGRAVFIYWPPWRVGNDGMY